MTVEQLKDKWHQNYLVEPDAELGINFRLSLIEKDGTVIAYIGTEDGYESKRRVANTNDIVELVKSYLENDF